MSAPFSRNKIYFKEMIHVWEKGWDDGKVVAVKITEVRSLILTFFLIKKVSKKVKTKKAARRAGALLPAFLSGLRAVLRSYLLFRNEILLCYNQFLRLYIFC